MNYRQYDIVMTNLTDTMDSEQGGKRPAIIVQNNIGNSNSTTTIIIPMSKKIDKNPNQPTHVLLRKSMENGLRNDSLVLAEQIRVVSVNRILWKIGSITNIEDRLAIKKAYEANFGF